MGEKIRIAVCEDDKTQRDYMERVLEKWAKDTGHDCEVDHYVSAEQLLFSVDTDFYHHIFFLDIQMGEMNGMELAHKIREKDRNAVLIFLTGLRDYALEGYQVEAYRYLIKPVKEEELHAILNQVMEEKIGSEDSYYVLELHGELVKIPYDEIWYLAAQGHYVVLAYGKETGRWKESYGKLQDEFEENGFVVVRRGVLVNLARVARVGKTDCILDNGEALPISRSQYKKVNEAFIAFYRKGLAN